MHPKVHITTYALCGTGLGTVKVANYCVHYGISKDINEVAQATVRSTEQPLDQLMARTRDAHNGLFGEDGFLGEIVALFGTGEESAE
ncbi:hypothetical protein CMEL01_16748 [Colletotrichum melonis]|uniref:Uncharacterized protein n=1 Tax=Colletotrichum melonis TaxID=1209925 RepID=A0AAI9U6D3_9PEZI|nr:hypothetical protein CMEL01_16748 [Colletotrichum melonis]